jgi:hypothetical protein
MVIKEESDDEMEHSQPFKNMGSGLEGCIVQVQ